MHFMDDSFVNLGEYNAAQRLFKKKEVNSEFAMTICKYLLLAVQMQSFARHVCVCVCVCVCVWERERERVRTILRRSLCRDAQACAVTYAIPDVQLSKNLTARQFSSHITL